MKKFCFFGLLLLMMISSFFVVRETRALDGDVGTSPGAGGILDMRNNFQINWKSHNHLHGLRVYVVRDSGTGGAPTLLSNVKDMTNNELSYDHPAYKTVQRFTVNSQGSLGYRWDATSPVDYGNSLYQQWVIDGVRHYGVKFVSPGWFEYHREVHSSTSVHINEFFYGLAATTPEEQPDCEPFENCLLKFLADDLGGFSDAMRENLKQKQNLDDVYIMLEPAMRYQWWCADPSGYLGDYCSSSNYPAYQHTYVLTATEGFNYANFHVERALERGQHVNNSYFRNIMSTVYSRAAHTVMNINPPQGATGFREFSALDQVRTNRNPTWVHPGCAGYTWRAWSWSLYSSFHASSDYLQKATNNPTDAWGISCYHCEGVDYRPDFCNVGSPVNVARANQPASWVNIANAYQSGDLVGRSGLGIGYYWLSDLVDDAPREGVCESAIDAIREHLLSAGSLPHPWRNFIDNYLGHEQSPANIKDCCDRSRPGTENEAIVYEEYVQQQETLANSSNLPAHQIHAQRAREIYENQCFPPEEEGDDCEYYVDVSCPDCDEALDSLSGRFGHISDIDNWDCIFISDEVAPVEFQDHYIQDSPKNDYCQVYCREDIGYVYPAATFSVPAGHHFVIGETGNAGMEVPTWGDLSFASEAECMPRTPRDQDEEPLEGDHDYLQIDHIKFMHDYIEANRQVGIAWDLYQGAYLREEARTRRTADGGPYYTGNTSTSCGYVYVGSESGETGCIEEHRRYSCSAYGSGWEPVSGADERDYDNFRCKRERNTGYYYSCPSGYEGNVSGCRTSRPRCWGEDDEGNSYSVPADRGSRCCDHLSGYELDGTKCVTEEDTAEFSHWECDRTDTTRLQTIRTINYEYLDPNYPSSNGTSHVIPRGTHDVWCAQQAHVNYSWESDSSSHGRETRYVTPYPAEYLDNPGTISAGRPREIPSASTRRQTYITNVNYRNSLVGLIEACNQFSYNFDNLAPNINLTYDDYKYDGVFPLDHDKSTSQNTTYYQEGREGPFARDTLDRYDCPAPEYPRGKKCDIGAQSYPINDNFYHRANLRIDFSLTGDVYRYVEKSNEQRGIFNIDSVSYHDMPAGHYIDIGYANLPVHYYQGEYPGFGRSVQREIKLNFDTPQTLGIGNRFNKFVFGIFRTGNIDPATCFSYECEYSIIYEFPPPEEDLNMMAKFRPIDLNDPFPGFDGGGREPGFNWRDQGKVENIILNNRRTAGESIYELDPMYVIELTPQTIGQVRNYNRTYGYNESDMNCQRDNHLECVSSFIDQFDFIKRDNCLGFDWDGCH